MQTLEKVCQEKFPYLHGIKFLLFYVNNVERNMIRWQISTPQSDGFLQWPPYFGVSVYVLTLFHCLHEYKVRNISFILIFTYYCVY